MMMRRLRPVASGIVPGALIAAGLLAAPGARAQTLDLLPTVVDATLTTDAEAAYTMAGRPVIRYQPERMASHSPPMRRFILMHEMAHIRLHWDAMRLPEGGWSAEEERAADRWAWLHVVGEGWTTDELRALREEMVANLPSLAALSHDERLANLTAMGPTVSMLTPAEIRTFHSGSAPVHALDVRMPPLSPAPRPIQPAPAAPPPVPIHPVPVYRR